MDLDIRPAMLCDLNGLLLLYPQTRPKEPALVRSPPVDRTWDAMLDNPCVFIAVAEVASILVATAMLGIVRSIAKGPAPFGVIEDGRIKAAFDLTTMTLVAVVKFLIGLSTRI